MIAVLDPLKPSSAKLHVIRRLNSSSYQTGERNGPHLVEFHPDARPPSKHATLAPLRDDVPLLDPCCGQLSAGAKVDLGVKGQRTFIEIPHVASALWVPPGFRGRPRTPNPSAVCIDLSEDEAWNSRRIPEAAVRAQLSGKIIFTYLLHITVYHILCYNHVCTCVCATECRCCSSNLACKRL